ncbi:MAG: hypothetical protein IJ830_01150 [Alphaproteobacteria bacterium]|nr:hypothetical protein [Alphaproteobacteria bacterium]
MVMIRESFAENEGAMNLARAIGIVFSPDAQKNKDYQEALEFIESKPAALRMIENDPKLSARYKQIKEQKAVADVSFGKNCILSKKTLANG